MSNDTSDIEDNHELANGDSLQERLEKIDLDEGDTCTPNEARERLGLSDELRRGYVDHWPGRTSAAAGSLTDQPVKTTDHND